MKATHRVKDADGKTVGFVVDGRFIPEYIVSSHIDKIDNLSINRNGIIRAKKQLIEIPYKYINKKEYKAICKENPFVRDIQLELLEWKRQSNRKILQVSGARQIGKTTELLKFAYKNYDYVIYVNLTSDGERFIHTVIENGVDIFSMQDYCKQSGKVEYIDSTKTILIIDEIQVSTKVYNSLRVLRSQLKCDIIITGSYLGQTLNKEFFHSMGTVAYLYMFPLSFKEFCRIFEKDNKLFNLDIYNSKVDKDIENLYLIYRQIGGYPEVIKTYIREKDINKCLDDIQELIETFKRESSNYFKDNKEPLIFKYVFENTVREMSKDKRGSGSRLTETVTRVVKDNHNISINKDEVANALTWLIYSGIVGECVYYNNGEGDKIIPLRRLYFLDCGIANYISIKAQIDARNRAGLVTETFAYCELHRLCKQKYSKSRVINEVPGFSTYNDFELDFMITDKNNKVYGIEVKTTDSSHKSLNVFIEKGFINQGIFAKLSSDGRGDKFNTIPIYTIGTHFPYE